MMEISIENRSPSLKYKEHINGKTIEQPVTINNLPKTLAIEAKFIGSRAKGRHKNL